MQELSMNLLDIAQNSVAAGSTLTELTVRIDTARRALTLVIADNGKEVELTADKIRISGEVPAGMVFVDGSGVGDVGSVVLRDRKRLAEDGIIIIVASIDRESGDVVSGPDVVTRGFVYVRESEQLMEESRRLCESVLAECVQHHVYDFSTIRNRLRDEISRLTYARTKRSPMVLPILMGV